MKDILHPLCLAIAGTGFLLLLRDLRKDRRNPALVALAFTYGFSALSYVTSITWVWVRIDGFFGITNVAVPIAQGCVVLVLALQASVLAHWSRPVEAARRRTRHLLIAAGVVIAAMAVLFALLTPTAQRPTDFSLYYAHDPYFQAYLLLYMVAYTIAEVYLALSCWKYARATSNRSISTGLRLVAIGATITLGYSGIRMAGVFGGMLGFSVKGLDPYAWLCGDIGATLTQIGYFLPTLALRLAALRSWIDTHLAYRRLQHLWAALTEAHPGITLLQPDRQHETILQGRSVNFPLLRRSTEIRHGQKLLRRYLDPAVLTESEARRGREGLRGADLAAAVTADQIGAALVRLAEDAPVDTPVDYADSGLPLPGYEEELHHLERVAGFFTAPRTTGAATDSASTTSGART
ncbi:MAB_1171c family putative transporter [Streptomyces sp. NPDC046988]|uniref:MAB_1171c family putative transporter n=1 Tax=Streptomyces sp. NPDC046988 TaxID=3154922 RepID=UPI0033F82CB4